MRSTIMAILLVLIPPMAAMSQDAPDRAAILAAVDRHFAGMKARDTAMMASVSYPGASTVAASYRDGRVTVTARPTHENRPRIATSTQAPNEWLLAAEVWQDGDVASVWAPYEIQLGDRLLHCGYDGYHMVREQGRWQIAGTVFTARPDDCPAIRSVAKGPMPLPAPSAEERKAVMAVVDTFFAAMVRKDTTLLSSSFTGRGSWVVASYRNGPASITRRPTTQDAPMIARSTDSLRERMFDAVVRVDGDVALVWGPYQFRVGSQVSHCGYDGFHLVRENGRWRIEGGVYTVRPNGCARLIGPRQVDSLPSRPADHTASYGADLKQVGELRLPSGPGPFPVAVVIHGGCWQRSFASANNTAPLSEALRQAGIATWNVEYRTADEPGGGWPGTFHDVSDATDYIRTLARTHPLDTTRVITVGHSAGGHLALWLTARSKLPAASPLRRPNPLAVRGAAALGPVMDLHEAAVRLGPSRCADGVGQVLGGTRDQVPDNYRIGTPIGLLPLGTPHAVIVGDQDGILPVVPREDYVRQARLAGDRVSLIVIPGAGHFEVIAPTTPAWTVVLAEIKRLLEP